MSGLTSRKLQSDKPALDGESHDTLRHVCATGNVPIVDMETVDLVKEKAPGIADIMACRSDSEDDVSSPPSTPFSPPSTPLIGNLPNSSASSLHANGHKEKSEGVHPDANMAAKSTDINEHPNPAKPATPCVLASNPAPSRVANISNHHNEPSSSNLNTGSSEPLETTPKETSYEENTSARSMAALSQDAATAGPDVLYMLIKSRRPRLVKQLWKKSTLAIPFHQLCDDVASEIDRAHVQRVDFKLSSDHLEIPHSVDREHSAQFDIMRDIFWNAMLDDMVTNGNTKFEIQLEPDAAQSVPDLATPEKCRRDELKHLKPW